MIFVDYNAQQSLHKEVCLESTKFVSRRVLRALDDKNGDFESQSKEIKAKSQDWTIWLIPVALSRKYERDLEMRQVSLKTGDWVLMGDEELERQYPAQLDWAALKLESYIACICSDSVETELECRPCLKVKQDCNSAETQEISYPEENSKL
ncbi:hypothetical protein PPACK8108_LOCUS1746 [Phakopsora pachyrhizi]|uniref:Uncharacterized protein n=1 Tax=Phakopsora pachyrhizi TaxID=170000 RepID=A0AAV0AGG8_PHAPC|nr:hypothetical protein PPACK8108_LOCUS1746 [Phakopsora pachyrhizi]